MKEIILSDKEYRERFCKNLGVTERFDIEEPIVYLPPHHNTNVRLHEMYHATKSPYLEEMQAGKKWLTPYEKALDELKAEEFVSQSKGKSFYPWNAIFMAARRLLDEGVRPSVVLNSVTKALADLGWRLNDNGKSTLW
jgi:hypothetical protein